MAELGVCEALGFASSITKETNKKAGTSLPISVLGYLLLSVTSAECLARSSV